MDIQESILAFDPGGTTGVAFFHSNRLQMMGEYKEEELFRALKSPPMSNGMSWWEAGVVIVEDYRVRFGKGFKYNHAWDNLPASQIIGSIKFWRHPRKVILQQASAKPMGYGYMHKKPPSKAKGNMDHAWDAAAHIMYYIGRKYGEVPNIKKVS